MAKRPAASRLIEWACGPSCLLGSLPLPLCWMNDELGPSRPSSSIGRAGHGAAAVVRDQDVLSGLVHDEVARARAARRLLVDRGQARRWPDRSKTRAPHRRVDQRPRRARSQHRGNLPPG